jgi:hypothetical protein
MPRAAIALLQCDKNATSAKQIAGGAQELCILRLLRLPCAIYSFILFQQARAVLFEPAQWPRLTGWLTSQRDLEDPNMRRFLLASTTLIALAAGFSPAAMTSSWAADFAPPAIIPYNWTGCFVGVQVGGGAQSGSQTGMTGIGMLGGGHAGCNYQIYSFVVGIEGEGA